jgi:hypothetical protein
MMTAVAGAALFQHLPRTRPVVADDGMPETCAPAPAVQIARPLVSGPPVRVADGQDKTADGS